MTDYSIYDLVMCDIFEYRTISWMTSINILTTTRLYENVELSITIIRRVMLPIMRLFGVT